MSIAPLPVLTATRYVQPLREGGSLPAVIDTHGGGLFVAKFRGAGQGVKALIAELIVGMLARHAGLPTPEPALIEIPDSFGRTEPDPEIQDLLRASHGVNVGAKYLDGAFNFDGNAAAEYISPELAARIVWFDAFVSNPDRTHRNPNLMIWDRQPYLIDHGAALYAQHDWPSVDDARTRSPFQLVKDHVLLAQSGDIDAADAELAPLMSADVIRSALEAVPDELLTDASIMSDFATPTAARDRYAKYLAMRAESPRGFVEEAKSAQQRASRTPVFRVSSRR
ncbi:MAG: HipA family kinase [Gemmatimonadaceae bacterium]